MNTGRLENRKQNISIHDSPWVLPTIASSRWDFGTKSTRALFTASLNFPLKGLQVRTNAAYLASPAFLVPLPCLLP